jgi:hypothetical protein
MAFRTVIARVTAGQRATMDDIFDGLFTFGSGTFSIPLRPSDSQGPATHYGFNAAGLTPEVADAISALNDGTLPTTTYINGVATGTPPVYGEGILPSEAQVQAAVASQNLISGNMAGGGPPDEHWAGFVGGLNLEIVTE